MRLGEKASSLQANLEEYNLETFSVWLMGYLCITEGLNSRMEDFRKCSAVSRCRFRQVKIELP